MKFNVKKISLLVAVIALGVFTLMSFSDNNDTKSEQTTVATASMDAQASKCGDGKCGDGKCADMKAKKDDKAAKATTKSSCAGKSAASCKGKDAKSCGTKSTKSCGSKAAASCGSKAKAKKCGDGKCADMKAKKETKATK
jgi:uncharacterized low-complexity protein